MKMISKAYLVDLLTEEVYLSRLYIQLGRALDYEVCGILTNGRETMLNLNENRKQLLMCLMQQNR